MRIFHFIKSNINTKQLVALVFLFLLIPRVFSQDVSLKNSKVITELDSIYNNTPKDKVFPLLLNKMDFYRHKGDYISTIVAINKILKFYGGIKNKRTVAGFNTYLGQAYNGLGLYSETISKVSGSLIYAKKNKDVPVLISSLMILSEAYEGLGIKAKSEELMHNAYKVSDTISDINLKKIILGNYSITLMSLKKYNKALNLLNKLQSLEANKEKPTSLVHLNKCECFLNLNKLDSSFYYCNRFSKELSYHNNKHNKIALDILYARIFYKEKEYKKAEKIALNALQQAKKQHYNNQSIEIYEFLSNLYKKTNNSKYYKFNSLHKKLKDSIATFNLKRAVKNVELLNTIEEKTVNIENLELENKLKASKIKMLFILLFSIAIILLIVFYQKSKINKAYKKLIKENINSLKNHEEIVNLRKKVLFNQKNETLPKKDSNISITTKQIETLEREIRKLFDIEKIFLNPNLDLDYLANKLKTNRVYVSYIFNTIIKMSFNEMLNKYRINEAKKLLILNNKKFTIEAIAQESGFKNKVTFNRNFKSITGVTPSFFIKMTQDKDIHI